jgi:D-glycero-D-manno-heptose 1,7-bisphosphate phosphatase
MPTQAVILAGGRGQRLSPITDTIPKPMVMFHGKPFLQYLIEFIRDEGFQKVLLLLGYLPEKIESYFKDGSELGIKIEYSIADASFETGLRLLTAKEKIEDTFFLMYCDNYCPVPTRKMWEHFVLKNTLAQITAYSNLDNYTKNNLIITNGIVTTYDKSRSLPNLGGVDIGFAFMKKEVLNLFPNENLNFEKIVYPKLVADHQLAAFTTDHRYYSVGSHERLPLTDQFLKQQPTVFLDRDGVLNQKAPKAEYITKWQDFKWLPRAKESVALLKQAGYRVILITNQAGIARKKMTVSDLLNIHENMQSELAAENAKIDAIYYCPHGWDENCLCRKPKPGMLLQAQKDFSIDLTRTIFIGDDERDEAAGQAAGCKTVLIKGENSLYSVVKKMIEKNNENT